VQKPIEMPFGGLTHMGQRFQLDGDRDPPWEEGNLGVFDPGRRKTLGVSAEVYAAKNNPIVNNGMTAGLLQPTAIMPNGRCSHYIVFREKSFLLTTRGFSSNFFDE